MSKNTLYVPKIPIATYQKNLVSVVKKWKQIYEVYIANDISRWFEWYQNDSPAEELTTQSKQMENLFLETINSNVPQYAQNGFDETNRIFRNQWETVVKTGLGIALLLPQKGLEEKRNLFSLSSVALMTKLAFEIVGDISRVVLNGFRLNKKQQLGEELKKIWTKARNRAKLIARDQLEKQYGELNRDTQLQYGVKEYTWVTAGDERVRDSHSRLDNRICSWSDDSVVKSGNNWVQRSSLGAFVGIPGQDYNCRCVAYPIFPIITSVS